MKRREAELILFWRQFLAGEMPPLVRGLAGAYREDPIQHEPVSVSVSGSGSDQRAAASVGDSRERPAVPRPLTRPPSASGVPPTNSLTPTLTRPASREPASMFSSQAAATLAAGLTRLAVRYLLAQGGAHPDVSLVGDRRINQRALWTEPLLALDFRQPFFNLLAHLARAGTPPTESAEDLGAGGEVALLMIADELASRPRADILLTNVTARSALAWLVHGGAGDRPLPDSTAFEDALFFARGRLARAWLEFDPLLRAASPTLNPLLERAHQRALAWARYRECVLARRRFDLLAPLCAAATALWAAIDADRLLARVEEIGRFAGESPRQDAYQRLLACYGWLADLEDWAAQARQLSRYDDEFDRWQVYLAYYGRMPEATHGQSTRLLAQLRRTL